MATAPKKATTKKKDPAIPENVDNYQLPQVTDANTKPVPEFVEPESQATEVDAAPVKQEAAGSLDGALDAALTPGAQGGTLAYELNFCINRFKGDKEGRKAETKYRLQCLASEADDELSAKISAVLENL